MILITDFLNIRVHIAHIIGTVSKYTLTNLNISVVKLPAGKHPYKNLSLTVVKLLNIAYLVQNPVLLNPY